MKTEENKINAVVRFKFNAYIDVRLQNIPGNITDGEIGDIALKQALMADNNEFVIGGNDCIEQINRFIVDENGNEVIKQNNNLDTFEYHLNDERIEAHNLVAPYAAHEGFVLRLNDANAMVGGIDIAANNA